LAENRLFCETKPFNPSFQILGTLMMFLQRSLRGRDDAYTTKLGIDQPHQRDLTEITSAPIT
jgi:hypothetical protein